MTDGAGGRDQPLTLKRLRQRIAPVLLLGALLPGGPTGLGVRAAGAAGLTSATSTVTSTIAATSADGRLMLLAQPAPPCLVVLDAHGTLVHTLLPASREGRIASRIAAMRTAPLRRSFIVAPADLPELWEISYDPQAEELYDGLVHDYRFGEGVPRRGYLGLRRTALAEPLVDFVLDVHEAEAWGLAPPPPMGSGKGQVINLDVRRRVAVVPTAEMQMRLQARAQERTSASHPSTALSRSGAAAKPWACTTPVPQRP